MVEVFKQLHKYLLRNRLQKKRNTEQIVRVADMYSGELKLPHFESDTSEAWWEAPVMALVRNI